MLVGNEMGYVPDDRCSIPRSGFWTFVCSATLRSALCPTVLSTGTGIGTGCLAAESVSRHVKARQGKASSPVWAHDQIQYALLKHLLVNRTVTSFLRGQESHKDRGVTVLHGQTGLTVTPVPVSSFVRRLFGSVLLTMGVSRSSMQVIRFAACGYFLEAL